VRVDRLRVAEFRPYVHAEVGFAAGVTAIVGPNGAGKTSLLEAVHMAVTGYSPRTSTDARCVRDGASYFRTEVAGFTRGGDHTAAVGFTPGEAKRITLDGKGLRSRDALEEWWACLVFLPDRLAVVKRAPSVRRAYLDRAVSRLEPGHLADVTSYTRALAQRNALLRRIRAGVAAPALLEPWDEQLAVHGAAVVAARLRAVGALAPVFADRLELLGGQAGAALRYVPRVEGDPAALRAALADRRARDVERAATGTGPHLDEVALEEGRRELRSFGSQGEQRTAVLALLLAEAALLTERRGEPPILLLDDVVSELDTDRRRRLVAAVRLHGQAIITTTEVAHLPDGPDRVLAVAGGTVSG
jgi:DNA replication and repair protein RecF